MKIQLLSAVVHFEVPATVAYILCITTKAMFHNFSPQFLTPFSFFLILYHCAKPNVNIGKLQSPIYHYEFSPIFSTSDRSYVTKGIADVVPVPEDLVFCRGYKQGHYDGTFGLIPCCNLLSYSQAKCAAFEEARYIQLFQESGKKSSSNFPHCYSKLLLIMVEI